MMTVPAAEAAAEAAAAAAAAAAPRRDHLFQTEQKKLFSSLLLVDFEMSMKTSLVYERTNEQTNFFSQTL